MRKSVFLIVLFSVIYMSSAQAQLSFGVKAGVNVNNISLNKSDFSTDNLTGFQVGPMLEWVFFGNLGIETGAFYSQRGIKIKSMHDIKINKNVGYLDIPVNLKLMIGSSDVFRPYLAAGPYVSFNLSDSKINDQWEAKSFAAGINLGAGVRLIKFLQIGINYGMGLTDDYNATLDRSINDLIKAQSKTWSVTAGIYF